MINVPVGNFHNQKCRIEYGTKKTNNLLKKSKQIEKKNHIKKKKNKLKTRKDAAVRECHKFIRLRDKGNPCICCGKPTSESSQAGHWIPSGQNPQVRFDEDNIHLQNLNCNFYKGGDSGNYKFNLIKKIGIERTEKLESLKGGTMKRTAQDYLIIEHYYKAKIKQLNTN